MTCRPAEVYAAFWNLEMHVASAPRLGAHSRLLIFPEWHVGFALQLSSQREPG